MGESFTITHIIHHASFNFHFITKKLPLIKIIFSHPALVLGLLKEFNEITSLFFMRIDQWQYV